MSNPKIELFSELLETCITETAKVAGGVREQDRLLQLKDGKAHPLWLVGHLTNTLNTIVLQWVLGAESALPRAYGRTFAPDFAKGAPITKNPADYPGWDEVLEYHQKIGAQCVEGIKTLQDADLSQPLKGPVPDSRRDSFKTNQIALTRMINHDNYHRGQIGLLSKLNA